MSGKSFYLRQLFWSQAIPQAVGASPAEKTKTYPFKRILFVDRPDYIQDVNLSAYGHDVFAHVKVLEAAKAAGGPCMIFIDEVFSSVPERYQAALGFAVVSELLEQGHFVVVSSHCHSLIDALLKATAGRMKAVHFNLGKKADSTYYSTFKKADGHAPSEAVAIAESLGMPKDMIEFARLAA